MDATPDLAAPRRGPADLDRWLTRLGCLCVALVAVAVYAHTLGHGWVYDDQHQILRNRLIQLPEHTWTALTSDVWSFKGDGESTQSNYWRPAFVGWLIINHRLFGLESPAPWHATTIALHALASVLSRLVARRAGVEVLAATTIGLIFAVHPVHVESVAWISGVTDPLMTVGVLGALLLLLSALLRPRFGAASAALIAGAMVLHLVAMGTKELAVFFPAVAFLAAWHLAPGSATGLVRRAARSAGWAAPFALLAGGFLLARSEVLGAVARGSGSIGLEDSIRTMPLAALWYLRQAVWPWPLAPTYEIPIVHASDAGLMNLHGPVLLLLGLGALTWAVCSPRPGVNRPAEQRRVFIARLGVALAALPLVPALNVGAFSIEQPVHDRYLYLPLLGLLLFAAAVTPLLTDRLPRLRPVLIGLSLAACVPLAISARAAAAHWATQSTLWRWGVATLPESTLNQRMLAYLLLDEGDAPGALAAIDRALAVRPSSEQVLLRADILVALGRAAEAESTLRALMQNAPRGAPANKLLPVTIRLAVAVERLGRPDEAVGLLREARDQIPSSRASLTEKIAVMLVKAGRRDEAQRELEAVVNLAERETNIGAQMVLYRLGILYSDAGRAPDARPLLERFLRATTAQDTPVLRAARRHAEQLLGAR